jgi:hypothetical protein
MEGVMAQMSGCELSGRVQAYIQPKTLLPALMMGTITGMVEWLCILYVRNGRKIVWQNLRRGWNPNCLPML